MATAIQRWSGVETELYSVISAIRNNVAHALTDRDERNFVADIQNYQRRCDKVAQVFKRLRKQDFLCRVCKGGWSIIGRRRIPDPSKRPVKMLVLFIILRNIIINVLPY